jgi:flavodoxin
MKKAIVYYSKTNNTKSVAERFEGFDLLEIKATSDDPNQMKVELLEIPDIAEYDYLIFACPVHGFQVCKIMKAYLKQLPDLSGKTIDLFITHQFPFAFLGGKQSLWNMRKLIRAKNGEVRNMTSINWSSGKRESDIINMINQYTI